MRRLSLCILVLGGILLVVNPVMAQQGLLETVVNGCKQELEKYCSNVTPGRGGCLPVYTLTRISSLVDASMPCTMPPPDLSGP